MGKNHKAGFEEALLSLSRGKLHEEDYNCHFQRLFEAGNTLTARSLEIVSKLKSEDSQRLESAKELLNQLEYQKQAIFYFAIKELVSEDFMHLSNLIFHYAELKQQTTNQ